jgi:hypothetical protein
VDGTETDELWPQVGGRINSARGWSLRPLARLGLPRAARRTWIAEAAGTEAAGAQAAATSRRLREFLEPARGHRLPSGDLVHGDLGLANVLAADGVITSWTGTTSGLAAERPTWPARCSNGTGCAWRARGG